MKLGIKVFIPLLSIAPTFAILAQIAPSQFVHPLEERTYLSTDKPYYYAGEKIWFKVYLNYRDRARANKLSRVLYVEWISPKNEIAETLILPVSEGTSAGSFTIPVNTEPGMYRLRSYTNWMNNFATDNLFVRTIPVLELNKLPVVDSTPPLHSSGTISATLTTNQAIHRPKGLISVTLRVTENSKPVKGNFSLSVVDQNLVVPVHRFSNSQSILEAYPFKSPTQVQNHGVAHPIEYGISLGGRYSEKGKNTKGAFAVVQGSMENMTVMETDPSGSFWITGLQFTDTSEIGFRYINHKTGRGKIQFSPRYVSAVPPLTAVDFPIAQTSAPTRQELYYRLSEDTRMLDEVVVKATPLTENDAPTSGLGRADYTIDTKKLLRVSSTNLAEALVGSIPGLMTYRSLDGFTFFFAEAQNFKEVASPLLIIDGYQFTGDGAAFLSQINPATVKSVEVVRFGGASMFGLRAAGGVISIETFQGGLDNTPSEFRTFDKGFFEKATAIGYTSAALVPFKPRDYRNPEMGGVDYRSTIYWNPYVQTDESGETTVEFFAAADESTYEILVEGITEAGVPLRATLRIPIVR